MASTAGRAGTTGLLVAAAGVALFAWLVFYVEPGVIWTGFRRIGWWLVLILLLGGLRFAARAAAWTVAIEPPYRLRLSQALAASVCGDALGNLTPLGPIVGEPAKVAYVRGRVPLGTAVTALAIENVVYTMSAVAMIAAGTLALLFSVDLPLGLREFSEVALAGIAVFFAVAAWMAWRRPALISRWLPAAASGRFTQLHARIERLRAIEDQVYTFAARRRAEIASIVGLELAFHALGVIEAHVTLWLTLGTPPTLLTSFIVESVNRLIIVAFKFVPFQIGVGEAGGALITHLLGLGTAPGLTLSIVRKARMAAWSLVGTSLLVRHGLSARRILEDAELNVPPSASL